MKSKDWYELLEKSVEAPINTMAVTYVDSVVSSARKVAPIGPLNVEDTCKYIDDIFHKKVEKYFNEYLTKKDKEVKKKCMEEDGENNGLS